MMIMTMTIEFYTAEEYQKLLEVADDRDELEPNYAIWLEKFNERKASFEKRVNVVAIPVNVGRLVLWCKANKVKNIAKERVVFAHELKKMVF